MTRETEKSIEKGILVGLWQQAIRVRGDYRQIAQVFEAVTARYREVGGDRLLAKLMDQVSGRALTVAGHLDTAAGQLIGLVGDRLDEREHDKPREGTTSLAVDLDDVVVAWAGLVSELRSRENDVVRLSGRLCRPELRGTEGPHQVTHRAWRESGALRADAELMANRLRGAV